MAASSWNKFCLLMWKNWLLQWRHKTQTLVEILVPVLFSALLVLIRSLVDPDDKDQQTYDTVSIDTLEPLKEIIDGYNLNQSIIQWHLIYSPRNGIFGQLMQSVSQSLNLNFTIGVNTTEQLQNLVPLGFVAGIDFHHDQSLTELPENLNYSIRFPAELRSALTLFNSLYFNWKTNLVFPRFQIAGPRNSFAEDGGIPPGYRQEGFLAIQNAIAGSYLKMASSDSMPAVMLRRYPYPAYRSDILLTGLETLVSFLILLSFVYPCINTVKFIASEKEKQLKEAMKIMGLSNWLHWTGWFVRTMLYFTFSITLMVVLFKTAWYKNHDDSIFTATNWFTLWLFLFIYSIVTTMFCFMLSVFFSKANTAAAVAGLLWFLFYSAYSFTMESYDELPLTTKLLLCLFSNTAMAYGFQLIVRFEGTGEGLQWHNLWKPVSIDDELTVGMIIVMMLVCSVIYLLIALYVEKIFPGEYGVPEPWYFPFRKSFWCPQSQFIGIDDMMYGEDSELSKNCEHDPIGKKAGIQVKDLRKVYANKKIAVNGLSLNMFDDQITVLLGHNGAGKTTTMSMLCGMFTPSSGTAVINGKDIRTDIQGVRNSLGLCPQHNILFDELTVREHIVFYSRLKGLRNESIEEEVLKYVRLIDLEDKINATSSTLSGGMKRKLSVCVAFCGGSKVVLCDEPTSGMDPAARRALWDVLKLEKKGRTVLLSTHFMDEADILGDRIAIMANGDLKCCGSSYFLKKRFGVGYHLICVKKDHCDSDKITNLLQKYIPEVVVENDIGTELSYLLSNASSDVFRDMFKELEDRIDELKVESYGVSLTTMEEVFMKVGADANQKPDADDLSQANGQVNGFSKLENGTGSIRDDTGSISTCNYGEDVPLLKGVSLTKNQIIAMFKKKYLQTIRSWLLMVLQIVIPVIFLMITILAGRERAVFNNLPAMSISLNSYEETVTVLETNSSADPLSFVTKIAAEYKNMSQNSTHVTREVSVPMEEHILLKYTDEYARVNSRYIVGASITNDTNITAWFNNQPYHGAPLAINLVHNAVVKSRLGSGHSIHVTNAPLPFATKSRLEMLQTGGTMGFQLAVNVAFAMAFVAAFYMLAYIKERECRSKLLQIVSGVNVLTFWITAFIWDFITFFITMLFLILTFAAFQEDGWSTPAELGRVLFILTSFAFSVLPITFLASMLFSVPATGFTRMTMFYVFTGIACFFTVFIMSMKIYDLEDIAKALTSIFLIFPHFALSHALNNFNTVTQLSRLCSARQDACIGCKAEHIFFVYDECRNIEFFAWEEPGIGRDIVYMFSVGGICFIILLLIEYRIVSAVIYYLRSCCNGRKVSELKEPERIDSDVQDEKTRIAEMTKEDIETHNLVLKDMTKIYGQFPAVSQMSVGVDQSECFGLLGINGAGKTSTFKMLTGDEKITSGEAWVRGVSLKSNMNTVNQMIGYCPQFDALIEDLTGRETLEIYCLLRGVPRHRIRSTSITLATDLNFIRHIDKKVKEYSGGNKRKLSTAVALIGNPAVVYLDEPTTGLDPGAKRHLWNMICKIRNSGKSIVLTSHSMDECEALCTRLAIMVNGEFKCIGSVQHLKNKFSKGFTLVVKLKKESSDQLRYSSDIVRNGGEDELTDIVFGEFIKKFKVRPKSIMDNVLSTLNDMLDPIKEYIVTNLPGAYLQEEYQGLLTYYIPNAQIKWSTMFGLMEDAKRQFNIEDYSLSQTTLEQVFLSFTKHQREDKRLKNEDRTCCQKYNPFCLCWHV